VRCQTLFIAAAGNSGPVYANEPPQGGTPIGAGMGIPGIAKNALTVGGSESVSYPSFDGLEPFPLYRLDGSDKDPVCFTQQTVSLGRNRSGEFFAGPENSTWPIQPICGSNAAVANLQITSLTQTTVEIELYLESNAILPAPTHAAGILLAFPSSFFKSDPGSIVFSLPDPVLVGNLGMPSLLVRSTFGAGAQANSDYIPPTPIPTPSPTGTPTATPEPRVYRPEARFLVSTAGNLSNEVATPVIVRVKLEARDPNANLLSSGFPAITLKLGSYSDDANDRWRYSATGYGDGIGISEAPTSPSHRIKPDVMAPCTNLWGRDLAYTDESEMTDEFANDGEGVRFFTEGGTSGATAAASGFVQLSWFFMKNHSRAEARSKSRPFSRPTRSTPQPS
jgi:hypothetical protein